MTDSALSILDVLAYYGARTGRISHVGWRSIKCPFHKDTTASASVNVDLGGFKCHTCGISGDPIKLIIVAHKLKGKEIGFSAANEFARSVLGKSSESVSQSTTRRAGNGKRKPRRFISV